jgi:eukaryotic-like serine/threonine-protein kinase
MPILWNDKLCLACNRQFSGERLESCPYDKTQLVNLAKSNHSQRFAQQLECRDFEVLELLNQSSRAEVYLAKDLSNQKFAIKVFFNSPNIDMPAILTAYAEQQRRIRHESICKTIAVDSADSYGFLIMEPIYGVGLDLLLHTKALLASEAIQIISAIADGLEAAHAQGVMHGDLSPANILITESGGNRVAKLCGFSAFRHKEHTQQTCIVETLTTYLGYSLSYAAPDARGLSSDQYSLACILYQCLTGRQPFVGTTPIETAMMHRSEPIPSILADHPELQNGRSIDTVLQKAMAKKANDRFPSMKDFRNALLAI